MSRCGANPQGQVSAKLLRHATTCAATVALVAVVLGVPARGGAQSLSDEIAQPAIVPRTVLVLDPIRVYADPTQPPNETALRGISLVALAEGVERMFAADPRFLVGEEDAAQLLAASRSELDRDTETVALRSVDVGIEYYRTYNLESAIDQLEDAVELLERTLLPWTAPESVADAWLYLGLAHLEAASSGSDDDASHGSAALVAFRQMIALDPGRRLTMDAYPPTVVEAWQQAYAEHLYTDGAGIALDEERALQVARRTQRDEIVYLFVLADAERPRIGLQVFDAITRRMELDVRAAVGPTTEATLELVGELLTASIACQGLVEPPPPENPNPEAGHLYLMPMFSTAFYLETPSRALFFSRGVAVDAQYLFTETFGVYGRTSMLFGARDQDGDLLSGVETLKGSFGIDFNLRVRRSRFFLAAGLEVARIGRLRATDDFWCKVTEGEITEPDAFGPGRDCEEEMIVDNSPRAQSGAAFAFGWAWRIFGPFWFSLQTDFSLYVLPFDNRPLDLPAGGRVGLGYRF